MSLIGLTAVTVASAAESTASLLPMAPDIAAVVSTATQQFIASALPSAATTTAPVTSVAVQVPAAFEIIATFAGALAGALIGVKLHFDLVGLATLAVVSGLGGGIIRDVLLQDYGIYALENPRLLIATLTGALVVFFFFSLADRLQWSLFLIDALALGMFAAIGSDKALIAGLAVVPAILIGAITAVGGGLLRDVITNDVPQVLRPGGYYATVAVAGSACYIGLAEWLNVVKPLALFVSVTLVVALRLMTHWLGWQTSTATDLTPLVAGAPQRAIATGGRALGWARRTTRLRRPDANATRHGSTPPDAEDE